jgi:dTDP-4-amino-4,6-dideoxygalactose transaminase
MSHPLIPLVDIRRQHQNISTEIDAAISRVVTRGDFILGEDTREFEKEFAAFHQVPHCIGVGDGTAALHLALLALGIGPGDEVIVPTNTFIASILSISHAGARPVLVDCDPVYYTIDIEGVERALTSRTKVLMPVHLYGHPADMGPLLEIARDRNLRIVEDVAQAHAATYQERFCGTMGDVGCFSFYPGKNLGAYGDGGAIITHRPELAERVARLRNYGQATKNVHTMPGFNSRLDSLQAAVLRVKLRYLTRWNDQRRAAAASYAELLAGTSLQLPKIAPWANPVWHLYAVQTGKRALLQAALDAANITHGIHYPIPVHLQEACRDLGYRRGAFPVSESLAERILSLPMFPEITDHELDRVTQACMRAQPQTRAARERAVSMAGL